VFYEDVKNIDSTKYQQPAYFAICAEMMVIVFLSKPVKELWNINHMVYAWLPVATRIGSIIGCFSFGTLSDHFGRRFPFLIAIITTALFGIISAFATKFIFQFLVWEAKHLEFGGIYCKVKTASEVT
jgi:MFS family permease